MNATEVCEARIDGWADRKPWFWSKASQTYFYHWREGRESAVIGNEDKFDEQFKQAVADYKSGELQRQADIMQAQMRLCEQRAEKVIAEYLEHYNLPSDAAASHLRDCIAEAFDTQINAASWPKWNDAGVG